MKPKSQGKRVCGYSTYSKARASGNWDCIGEISGAPVPSWKEYRLALQTLSLNLPLPLHPYPCNNFSPPSNKRFPRKFKKKKKNLY